MRSQPARQVSLREERVIAGDGAEEALFYLVIDLFPKETQKLGRSSQHKALVSPFVQSFLEETCKDAGELESFHGLGRWSLWS